MHRCTQRWDRSHLLENLSGYETDCAMIGRDDWAFTRVHTAAEERDMRLSGLFGWAPNEGSTDRALNRILSNMKQVGRFRVDRMDESRALVQDTRASKL